ncbi:MAG: GTPase HflX, partial [Nitrospirota bacterium]
ELARTAGVTVLYAVIQRPKVLHPRYLMGEGKIKELIIKSLQGGANLIIFDQDLSPTQVKSIGEMTDMRVIDRTQLILDIFARRAHSRDGKVQVELAQLKYLLPRLVGTGKALSKLAGGIGGRGPGEMKLEIDRRRIRDRIAHLERELEHLGSARRQRKERRVQSGIPIVSIVGYTNAGKSSLLNSLTKSSVKTEDLLFATLDTSSRRLRFPREREIIITDTVGFIKELPEDLLGAFRATLDELKDAHLLLHVVDISNPRFEQHMESVDKIMRDLGIDNIEQLIVFNKMDKCDEELVKILCQRYNAVAVSAIYPETLLPLLTAMEERLF